MVLLIFSAILFLIAFPLGEFSRVTIGLTTSFTLLDTLVVLVSLIWLGRQIVFGKMPSSFQAKSFTAVIAVFLISLLLNATSLSLQQIMTASLYTIRFLCYGSLFFIFLGAPKKIKQRMPSILLIGGILLTVGGYIQYFFYPTLRNLVYFGWDEHFYRMFGTFFDPNFFGLFLAIFFLFIVWFGSNLQNKRKIVLVGFLALAVFTAILLTYSRTALVALSIGLFILFWRPTVHKKLLVLFGGITLVVVLFFAISNTKTDMNSLFRKTSTDARLGSARNALVIFSEKPLFGIGFNAYRYAQYRHRFMLGSQNQEDHGASGADSSMLLVLATSGIVGFGVFCLFLWSHIKTLIRAKNRIGLATLIATFIGSLFVNGLFYPLILVWLWVVLGITENTSQ